jgi:hypothetical protein
MGLTQWKRMLSISVLTTPATLGDTGVIKIPSSVHHNLKVLVVVNRHRDVIVVLKPLLNSDFVIS